MLQRIKKQLRNLLPDRTFRSWRNLYVKFASRLQCNNLRRLAELHGTDKFFGHNYIDVYEKHFRELRKQPITFLEIGVGGYDDPQAGGESMRMWKNYFVNGRIHAIDIFDKAPHQQDRIRIYKGSQADRTFLENVHQETGDFDLIIDDGSHLNEHIITSFKILFPKLKTGGIYAVEDIQTSYWPSYGGKQEVGVEGTAMSFFRKLADGLNHMEYLLPDYKPTYYDCNILSLHFYHNMVIIHKGQNTAKSNLVSDGILQPH
jgi:hypothetical protein